LSRSLFTSGAFAAWLAAVAALPACSSGAPSAPEPAASTSAPVLANGDFESGAAGAVPPSWTLTNYINNGITVQSPQTRAGLNLATGGKALTVTLAATNTADALLGASSSMRYCRYGGKCAIVNRRSSYNYTDGGSTNGQNVNSLAQTMTTTASDVDSTDGQVHVRFVVSPVLENPGHPSEAQPYYMVQVTNVTTGALLYSDFNLSAQPGVPWKVVNSGGTEYDYIDWSLVDVNGNGRITVGDQIKVEVIAAGCSYAGHLGQVYVDGGPGISVPGLFISGSAPSQVNTGVPIPYAISYKNASAAAATGVTLYFTTPPNTTFTSLGALPTGLTCTTPTVGTAGTISCTLAGSLAVNGVGAFNITVTPTAAATGTEVIAGTYGIDSAEESPLLGPKMRTFVGCTGDAQCTSGNWCNISAKACTAKTANDVAMPSDSGHVTPVINGTCSSAAGALVCVSAVCDALDDKCGYVNNSGACTSANAAVVCRSGVCDPDLKCGLANGNGTCSVANQGTVCRSKVCDGNDSKCGYAVGDGPCTSANEATVCRSGSCSTNGTCRPVGGCNVDADCAGGTWCMESTHTCTAKLANGTAMPTDAPHTSPTLDGTCTSAASTLVCTSAVCDTADAKCGYADGHGPCTSANESTVCRSGSCSTNGTCKPVGGCNVDGDCGTGNWCMVSTHTCTAKLSNGTAMPTDGAHVTPTLNGTCTAAAGALVCTSAVCDTADSKCGYADGDGPCTIANGAVVCRSGECSAGGTCKPAGGCNVDADCAGGNWCMISTHTCTPKLSNGTAMPTDGAHVTPALNGTCTTAASALVCASAVCDTGDAKCGYANGTGPCTTVNQATVCRSGACSTNGTCMPSGGCNVDGDCNAATEWCQISTHTCTAKLSNGTAMPTDGAHTSPTLNGTCTTAAASLVCTSAVCDTGDSKCGYANGTGPCTTTNQNTVCRSGTCSVAGTCMPSGGCNVDGDCATTEWCMVSTHACATKLANGTAMPTDAGHTSPTLDGTCTTSAGALVCTSAVCDASDAKCGYANGTGPCTAATGATVCRSGECSNDGKCKPAGGCNVDADCAAGSWCVISTHACTAKLSNGTAMPTDAGHVTPTIDGTCNGPAAALVCTSAVCDSADAKCGYANGHGTCDAATSTTVCRSGACGSDGKCGLPNGEGACTAANGATVCRSEVCDADGKCGLADGSGTCTTADGPKVCRSGKCSATSDKCVPATNGCAVDGDCTTAQWCKIATLTCQPKVANDVAMPSDTGHVTPVLDGKCAGPAATLTCVSGVCDPRDDKCGYDNEGTSSCTAANAATVCRSGFCSATGKCIAAASCLTDADCPAAWCNVSTKKCAPMVANGKPMPTDTAHGTPTLDGKCSTAAAALVCVAGVCETTDDQCGLANGSTCVAGKDATCRSNVCWAADLKCGKPVGETCTDSSECRSANCASGKCDGDADGDGVSDLTETALGSNPNDPDSDHDGVRDNVELSADHSGNGPFSKVDTDGDGTIDALDDDDDGDTVPTKDELGTGTLPRDTDADGKVDYLDADDDGDTVPTKDELGTGGAASPQDTDGDGKSDFLDADDDEDGVPTKDELGAGGAASPQDTDSDGKKNYLDVDDDGDSLLTKDELGPGGAASPVDTDGDTKPNYLDADDDDDTVLTKDELGAGGAANPVDTDGDGKKDYLDTDDDDDGILTSREVADGKAPKVASDDVDKDGKKNWLDTDADGDTILDGNEPNDADGDQIPDYLEAKLPVSDAGTIEGGGCSTSGTGHDGAGNVIVLAGLLALGAAARVRRRRHG
jgi:MYXO-CTERM domain-containing protein